MQEFVKQSGFVILALLVLVIIKQVKGDFQIPVKLVIAVALFGVFVGVLENIIGEMSGALSFAGVSRYASIMLKALFVGLITSICSNLCTDAGEGTLSYICTLMGKAQIIILALPLIFEILEMAMELIGGE